MPNEAELLKSLSLLGMQQDKLLYSFANIFGAEAPALKQQLAADFASHAGDYFQLTGIAADISLF